MKQKILLFMLLVMAVPVTMMADDPVEIDGIYYVLNTDDQSAKVSKQTPSWGVVSVYTGDLVIPSSVSYEGTEYSVKGIAYDAFWYSNVTSVTIPNSVTTIEEEAFQGCTSLTSINIPNSVTTIGKYAFSFSSLGSIEIPNSVTNIGSGAFAYSGLKSIEIPSSVTSIESNTFQCCALTSITIPSSVTSIGEYAFSDCNDLTSIEIPSSVTSIGEKAFYHCIGLTSIEIPSSVTSIGERAFSCCPGLTSITVDPANSYFDSRDNCNAIIEKSSNKLIVGCNETDIPNGVKIIGTHSFYCTRTSIEIPSSVTTIEGGAFYNCSNLLVVKCNATTVPTTLSDNQGLSPFSSCIQNATLIVPEEAVESYKTKTPWSKFGTIRPADVTITISSVGMATYCSPYDLDFSGITDFKACIATGYNRTTGNVIMQPVSDAPAGTGLYLQGTPGTYNVPCGESGSFFVNLLVGTTAATTISPVDGNYKNLILYNGSNGVGFYTIANDYPMGANKAYLQLPAAVLGGSAGANRIGVEFEDNLDGIENIDMIAAGGATWYSLNGCKLNGKPIQKGIYVVNGRKVVIK